MNGHDMKWLILILGIVSNTAASVLIKFALIPPRKFFSLDDPCATLGNLPLLFGLFLYGATFLLYAAALARFPLSVAHPILTSGAVAAVAVCSVVLLGEPFHWVKAVGVLFVILGVVLISISPN
jgi:small multidrug resistance pump